MRGRSHLFAWILVLSAALSWPVARAGEPPADHHRTIETLRSFHHGEALAKARLAEGSGAQAHQTIDVLHYDMDIALDPPAQTIAGTVTMRFAATASTETIRLRLHRSLRVTGMAFDGIGWGGPRSEDSLTFLRKKDDVAVTINPPMLPGTEHEVKVVYSGKPTWDYQFLGGVAFATHNGTPVAATESEPYAAFRWWPLVEDVSDKFTFDLRLTVPHGMAGVSNGTLLGHVSNADGTETYTWREGYPIATYLVCLNVTNYATFGDVYRGLDGNAAMPIDHFVYPEDLAAAMANYATIPDMILFYAGLAGEYPFLSEKFGQVEVPYPGMEHQTITAVSQGWTTGASRYPPGDATLMYAHELAHHWWGDDVTCGTWHDVWLNEGFGTYFEALWWARVEGLSEGEAFRAYDLDGQYKGYLKGTVYVSNENDPFHDEGAVYYKGAWVLHMLKKVMGEGPFYQALRAYRAAHRYGNATTEDLQAACESVYGQSLGWFFDEWVYTGFRPIYRISFSATSSTCSVTVQQLQKHRIYRRTSGADTYLMPVELTLHYSDGTSETRTVLNNQRAQTFALPISKPVTSVGFDEDGWVLKVVK